MINRKDFWDNWAVRYLDQPTTQIEKDAVWEIISSCFCDFSSVEIGWELSKKLGDELLEEEERERAIRICCHLWDEEKIFYSYRNDVWIQKKADIAS